MQYLTIFFYLITFLFPHSALAQTTSETTFLYNASGQRIARMEEVGGKFERVYYIPPSLKVTVRSNGTKSWRKTYALASNTSAVREGSTSNHR